LSNGEVTALARRERIHSGPGEADTSGSECARGEWCSGAVMARQPDGTMKRQPARTPRNFCEACRSRIGTCLEEMPSAYGRLAAEIGEPSRTGHAVRIPPGPRLPIRADVDALMRLAAESLLSWEERVRDVARLTPLDTALSRQRGTQEAVTAAVRLLAAHLDVLLGLEAGPMTRPGEHDAVILASLSGADAGNEILHLHYRCRSLLGETRTQPEAFDGIPCRECEDMALERAEPPSDPEQEAMHSRCASCGHAMTRKEFAEWAQWYATWAATAGLACRRCRQNRCAECVYRGCACAGSGHRVAQFA
jgi:hypothetical protein